MKLSKSWWVLFIVSLAVMIPIIAPYLTLDPAASRISIISTAVHYPLLVTHIAVASIALLSGFLQFIDRFRIKKLHIHRYLGRVYVCSVFVSGLLALVLIFYGENYTKATSFLALTLAWLFTTWKGYRAAIKREYDEHRKWMIRSFGITLVAVSARALVPILLLIYAVLHGFALPGGRALMVEEVLNVNIWAALVVNLVIIEWIILRSKRRNAK